MHTIYYLIVQKMSLGSADIFFEIFVNAFYIKGVPKNVILRNQNGIIGYV